MKSEILKRIKERYISHDLAGLKPYWYDTRGSIKTANIDEWEKPDPTRDTLVIGLEIDKILNCLSQDQVIWFNRILIHYSHESQRRIDSILTAFKCMTPVLPPRIHIDEKSKIHIDDGKHRFIVAYCLGVQTVPVVTQIEYSISGTIISKLISLGQIEFR